jgi:hypothetical protein
METSTEKEVDAVEEVPLATRSNGVEHVTDRRSRSRRRKLQNRIYYRGTSETQRKEEIIGSRKKTLNAERHRVQCSWKRLGRVRRFSS